MKRFIMMVMMIHCFVVWLTNMKVVAFSPAGANLESSRHLKTKIPRLHGKFFRVMDLFNKIGASRYQKLESNEKKIHERLHNWKNPNIMSTSWNHAVFATSNRKLSFARCCQKWSLCNRQRYHLDVFSCKDFAHDFVWMSVFSTWVHAVAYLWCSFSTKTVNG